MKQNAKYYIIGAGLVGLLGLGLLLVFTKNKGKKGKDKVLKNILFVGDSVTAGVGFSYSYLIKNKLTDKTVDILAVQNMQTSWMLTNLPAQLAKKKYDRVYIYGGINDIFSGVQQSKAVANIQAMVDLVVESGADAYVILGYNSQTAMNENGVIASYLTKTNYIIAKNKYIAYQKALRSTIQNATIVDEFQLTATSTMDGIHPSAAAHIIIANELLKNIK